MVGCDASTLRQTGPYSSSPITGVLVDSIVGKLWIDILDVQGPCEYSSLKVALASASAQLLSCPTSSGFPARPQARLLSRYMMCRFSRLGCVALVCVIVSSSALQLPLCPFARLRCELNRSQCPVLSVVCSSAAVLANGRLLD